MIQYKWNYGSRKMIEKAVDSEVNKHLKELSSNFKNMFKDYELITIIFTPQPYDGLNKRKNRYFNYFTRQF